MKELSILLEWEMILPQSRNCRKEAVISQQACEMSLNMVEQMSKWFLIPVIASRRAGIHVYLLYLKCSQFRNSNMRHIQRMIRLKVITMNQI